MVMLLVVDDESCMRGFLVELLSEKYTVLCARNGEEGLLIAQSICPDLVITDLEMPKMSGLDLVTHLRQFPKQKETPVIALSARFYLKEEREKMLVAGANFCLAKPINISLLHRKITQLLIQTNQIEVNTNFINKRHYLEVQQV